MPRPKGSKNKKGSEKVYRDELIVPKHLDENITLERVLRAKKRYVYQYTKIEYEGKKPIEIVEYFDKNRYYIDKVVRDYNPQGIPFYKPVKNVRNDIKKLTDFNKPVIIKGKYFTVTIIRESRNIVVRNNGGNCLKYFKEEPYVGDKYYIISYSDTERDERRYFNGN